MESAGTDFQVLPDTLLMSKSGYPTNRGKEMSESTGNCLEEMSSNSPTYTQVSGMGQLSNEYPFLADCASVRTATAKCNSHKSNSGPTVKNVPSDSMASYALATNCKSEGCYPCHSHFNLFLGRKILQFDTHGIKHHSNQHERTDLIVPLHDIRICLHDQNLKNYIDLDLLYVHPHHPISSI